MRHRISNEFDYLVARAERETENARKILAEVRVSNDYWQEKAAAKLVAFCEQHERLLRLFAEIKLYYPDGAAVLEEKWQHIKALSEGIRREFAEFRGHE